MKAQRGEERYSCILLIHNLGARSHDPAALPPPPPKKKKNPMYRKLKRTWGRQGG